jgi:hypothetical protein
MFLVSFDMFTTVNSKTTISKHKVYVNTRQDVRRLFQSDGLYVTELDGSLRRIHITGSKKIYPEYGDAPNSVALGIYDDRDVSKFLHCISA